MNHASVRKTRSRRLLDFLFLGQARLCLGLCLGLALLLVLVIALGARPVLGGGSGILGSDWRPSQGRFGLLPFLAGSLGVTGVAMFLAGPLSILAAAYLSEHAGRRLRGLLRPAIDVLAGVPSVVFGLFGVVLVVPGVALLGRLLGRTLPGFSVLAGGIVLAVMILPFVLSLSLDVFLAIPREAREAAMALGATRWETLRGVLFRAALPGLVAAQVLGLARAFGETMAVVMVVGNVARMPTGLLDPACPVPALLANTYGEMMSVPRYEGALMLAALLLMVVVGGSSLAARLMLRYLQRSGA